MGIFWEIEEKNKQIEALRVRASYFPSEKEYCKKKIEELEKELQQIYNKLKGV